MDFSVVNISSEILATLFSNITKNIFLSSFEEFWKGKPNSTPQIKSLHFDWKFLNVRSILLWGEKK